MANPSICLCMIVRDEAGVITECLESARPYISSWVIADTGSVDGTPELITQALAEIPGELHHHAWVDFAHNRSQVMALARWRADYLLILDADNTVEGDPAALAQLSADAYMVPHEHGGSNNWYSVKRLVSGRLDWHYVGRVHEYIETSRPHSTARLDGLVTRSASVGAIRHGRWERDAVLLEAAVAEDPGDFRSRFYLARTYHDLGTLRQDRGLLHRAIEQYEARARMGGWHEEWYYSLYQAGALYAHLGDWPRAVERLLEAWQLRPVRLEALFDLVDGLLRRGRYRTAVQFTSLVTERPLTVPDDVLFVSRAVWDWGILAQHAVASLGAQDLDGCVSACRRLLALENLPPEQRRAAQTNLTTAIWGKTEAAVSALYAGKSGAT